MNMTKPNTPPKPVVDNYDFAVDGQQLDDLYAMLEEKKGFMDETIQGMKATSQAMTGEDGGKGDWTGRDAEAYNSEYSSNMETVGNGLEAVGTMMSDVDTAKKNFDTLQEAIASQISRL